MSYRIALLSLTLPFSLLNAEQPSPVDVSVSSSSQLGKQMTQMAASECNMYVEQCKRDVAAFDAKTQDDLTNQSFGPACFRNYAHYFAHLKLSNHELLYLIANYLEITTSISTAAPEKMAAIKEQQVRNAEYAIISMIKFREVLGSEGKLAHFTNAETDALIAREQAALNPVLHRIDRAECKICLIQCERNKEAINGMQEADLTKGFNAPGFLRHHAHLFSELTLKNHELIYLIYNYLKVVKHGGEVEAAPDIVQQLIDQRAKLGLSGGKLLLFSDEDVAALLA